MSLSKEMTDVQIKDMHSWTAVIKESLLILEKKATLDGKNIAEIAIHRPDFNADLICRKTRRQFVQSVQKYKELCINLRRKKHLTASSNHQDLPVTDSVNETDPPVADGSLGQERLEEVCTHSFSMGDNVEICVGDLENLQAKIIAIDGYLITVMPKHEDLKDPLIFKANELRRYFKTGDHVKVLAGRYEGATGLVVRVEPSRVVLVSDLTKDELEVLPRDLKFCTDVDPQGQFEWGDLVQLNSLAVGVIVRLEREHIHVLGINGTVIELEPTALHKLSERPNTITMDTNRNQIRLKDTAIVSEGPHAGRIGEIKHLYRDFAFLHSRKYTENGGIFVCITRRLTRMANTAENMSTDLETRTSSEFENLSISNQSAHHRMNTRTKNLPVVVESEIDVSESETSDSSAGDTDDDDFEPFDRKSFKRTTPRNTKRRIQSSGEVIDLDSKLIKVTELRHKVPEYGSEDGDEDISGSESSSDDEVPFAETTTKPQFKIVIGPDLVKRIHMFGGRPVILVDDNTKVTMKPIDHNPSG